MKTRLCHEILAWYMGRERRKLAANLEQTESVQRRRLREIVASVGRAPAWQDLAETSSYKDLAAKIPVRTYEEYHELVERQRREKRTVLAPDVVRYEPTSGSTSARKWVPYTKDFLAEINRAASAWIGDLYAREPAIKSGRHYWSLSWLPEELRAFTSSDDADLFPWSQRLLLKNTMAVSSAMPIVANPAAAWWGSLVQLVAREDLALVSVWSPTFWLRVLDDITVRWDELRVALREGRWREHETELTEKIGVAPVRRLEGLDPGAPDFWRRLWPSLRIVSAWDSSSSARWSGELRARLPHVELQGKGLWATEGVVTIPFGGRKVLAIDSHFFEFRSLASGEIVPSWKVRDGESYQPILWTSSGFLRYALNDEVIVTGFAGQTPCLEFVGRLQSTDMVGEKIHASWVRRMFEQNPAWQATCLIACQRPKPHYILLHEGESVVDVEAALRSVHHYQVARELGQLGEARSVGVGDPLEWLARNSKSQIAGQNKVEVLTQVDHWVDVFPTETCASTPEP